MEIITLSHGSGGKATNKLIDNLFYKYFNNEFLLQNKSNIDKVKYINYNNTDNYRAHINLKYGEMFLLKTLNFQL